MTRFSAENKRRYFESYFVIKPLIEPIVYRSMGKKNTTPIWSMGSINWLAYQHSSKYLNLCSAEEIFTKSTSNITVPDCPDLLGHSLGS